MLEQAHWGFIDLDFFSHGRSLGDYTFKVTLISVSFVYVVLICCVMVQHFIIKTNCYRAAKISGSQFKNSFRAGTILVNSAGCY